MKSYQSSLECDCRKKDSCKLRYYADEYQIKKINFKGKKLTFKRKIYRHFIYESSKCIKCGICVKIFEKNNIGSGLCYYNRGFDTYIEFPFNREPENNYIEVINECIESCPTGALSYG